MGGPCVYYVPWRASRVALFVLAVASSTERWVQCTRCEKWRCVADVLRIDPGWHCRLNVLSPTHATCAAPQAPMPPDPASPSGDPPTLDPTAWLTTLLGNDDEPTTTINDDDRVTDETASADDLFVRSTCSCTTCTDINAAVDGWHAHDIDLLPPLLRCVIRAIDRVAPDVEALERDKRFVFRPDADPDAGL